MSTSEITRTSQSFDAEALRRGIEERDATTLLGLYAEDAELHVVDRNDQPSHPKIIRGRQAIGDYFADVCGRDMTHTIERLVVSENNAAFVQACRYPGGARVLCIAVLDLKDGLITRQSGVQAWDE
jgi:ketosteroid isomerase-like protein